MASNSTEFQFGNAACPETFRLAHSISPGSSFAYSQLEVQAIHEAHLMTSKLDALS